MRVPGSGGYPLGTTAITCSTTDGSSHGRSCPTSVTVRDTTRPVVTRGVTSGVLTTPWPPNHELSNVGFTTQANDGCAGPLPVSVRVYGNEDDQTPTDNKTVHSPDAANVAAGTLRLRDERVESGNGRIYVIVSQATDPSGNVGTACCTVAIPHDSKTASINAIATQAVAARSTCLANGGTPPTGYVTVGDGPVIGPKQ